MKLASTCLAGALLLAAAAPLAFAGGPGAEAMKPGVGSPAKAAPCSAAHYRQFDFFAGDWDVYDAASPKKVVGRNTVTVILGGCVVREVYRQNDGLRGESFSLYDAARGEWHQSWVTNRGDFLLLDGGIEGGRMVLTGTEKSARGSSSLLRGIWSRQGTAVRETAERSSDGGKTWKAVFDILFRPHRAGV